MQICTFVKRIGKRVHWGLLQALVVRLNVECGDYSDKNDNCQGYNCYYLSNESKIVDSNQLMSTSTDRQWSF